jgi:hypothetical protein
VNATPNVLRLVWPTRQSKRPAEKVWVTVNAAEMRRSKVGKKM